MTGYFGQDYDDDGNPVALGEDLDGAQLLAELHAALTTYVALPSAEAADAVTLWDAATHGQPAWEHATRLDATSPEKRCGKSRLLDIIEATCRNPLITVNISAAALARSVGDDPPTLLLDEADTIFGKGIKGDEKAETLRGLINAGHQRNRPYIRWDAATKRPENCPTFAMAALAGIGSLPDTITDRAVVIRMRRRAPGETVAAFRIRRDTPPLHALRDRLSLWIRAHLDQLRDAEPDLPVDDRAADNWTPLAAIADLAGGDWPDRARKAAEVLTAEADEAATSASLSLRLLADLRDIFGDALRMPTESILSALQNLDESPWRDYYGKPLDPRSLAKLLRPYGVRSKQVRIGDVTLKGYDRADLRDAWQRYCANSGEVSETSETPKQRRSEPSDCFPVSDTSETGKQGQVHDQGRFPVSDVSDNTPMCDRCGERHHRYGDNGRPCKTAPEAAQ